MGWSVLGSKMATSLAILRYASYPRQSVFTSYVHCAMHNHRTKTVLASWSKLLIVFPTVSLIAWYRSSAPSLITTCSPFEPCHSWWSHWGRVFHTEKVIRSNDDVRTTFSSGIMATFSFATLDSPLSGAIPTCPPVRLHPLLSSIFDGQRLSWCSQTCDRRSSRMCTRSRVSCCRYESIRSNVIWGVKYLCYC